MDGRLIPCANPVSEVVMKRNSLIAIFSRFLSCSFGTNFFVIFHIGNFQIMIFDLSLVKIQHVFK